MGARRRCRSEEGVDGPYLLSGARCEGAALRATNLPRSVAYLQKPTSMIRSATAQFAVVLVILGAVGAQVTANGGFFLHGRSLMVNGDASLVARLAGGMDALPGRYPYAASLRRKGTKEHFCAGVLVAHQWVLTAAHCVDGESEISEEKPLVFVGIENRSGLDSTRGILRTQEQYIHQNWTGNIRKGADIALLKLEDPLEDAVFAHADDGSLRLLSSQTLTVIGWGRSEASASLAENLQSGDVDLLYNENCQFVYVNETILDSMVCAGGSDVDACQGDSGGPLLFLDGAMGAVANGDPNLDYIVGIVSFGPGPCGQKGRPGVYTRVSSFSPWIKNVMKDQSSESEGGKETSIDGPDNKEKEVLSEPQGGTETGADGDSDSMVKAGGVHAPIGRYPYVVSLFHPTQNTFTCGGILLSPQWVVTLAQCVANSSFHNPPNPTVFVRDNTLNGVDIGEEEHATLQTIIHPNWTGNSMNGSDIALLKLRTAAIGARTTFIEDDLVDLIPSLMSLPSELTVVGWFRTNDPRGPVERSLQNFKVDVVAKNLCQELYDFNLHDSLICMLASRDVGCPGISRGAAALLRSDQLSISVNNANLDILYGITSFGPEDCETTTLPDAYTRVSRFSGWIAEVMDDA